MGNLEFMNGTAGDIQRDSKRLTQFRKPIFQN